jgi:hypothetical protein
MITALGAVLTIQHFLIRSPWLHNKVLHFIFHVGKMMEYFNNNNPLLLDFTNEQEKSVVEQENQVTEQKREPLFEEKYLTKFKEFPNEYQFTDEELEKETAEIVRIKLENERTITESINEIREKLSKLGENTDEMGDQMTDEYKNKLITYYNLEDDYEDDPETINFEELHLDLMVEKVKLHDELTKFEQSLLTDQQIQLQARQYTVKNKLDKLINCYILEHTPLGNIYMRFNNDKNSFEYFSNNTIPYRYLEPVGRKYVMTFWCKPIFVDIEEELKKAEIKYDEDKKKKEEDDKKRTEELKNMPKDVLARLKSYNKDNVTNMVAKNRGQSTYSLPPQIKAALPNVKNTSEKILLKENANRYTWEGRFANFSPIKKIDKKIVNKNFGLSFAEFKKMQMKK